MFHEVIFSSYLPNRWTHDRDAVIVMDARQQQRAFNWLLARGYPTAAPIMFRALWLSAAKATKAVPVISVILFYFYKNAQGCQSGIHRIIDVGCLAVRKMQKNIVQTLKQRMTSNRGLTSRLWVSDWVNSTNVFFLRSDWWICHRLRGCAVISQLYQRCLGLWCFATQMNETPTNVFTGRSKSCTLVGHNSNTALCRELLGNTSKYYKYLVLLLLRYTGRTLHRYHARFLRIPFTRYKRSHSFVGSLFYLPQWWKIFPANYTRIESSHMFSVARGK